MSLNSEANGRRIACVEQCFGSGGVTLSRDGRVLVGEGVLTKLCRKKTKPRIFFLFNDIIVYGNIVIHKKRYNKQRVIPLLDVKLEDVPDTGTNKNGWKIISPHKSFIVHAATVTEKKEWMAHIKKCVNDLLMNGAVDQTGKEAPVWLPDSSAAVCMHCNKYEFSIINRRHHCRNCGKVVCHPCSNQKWQFPEQSDKPLRVCLTCYHTLSSTTENLTPTYPNSSMGEHSSGDSSDDDETTNTDVPANTMFQSYENVQLNRA
ncbi:pleckstrin homology domain-containing family F member 2-like isoform X2 [Gigantopelta aegis]|uniref:pleckstrin homology domain-containing family F member 2-like isoform X2 n=1 Tax=Gigantopelta aegis TaxID=1735272 RepID=UPI001B889E64|nr:pleckstrin homology domain-containing family F member 2-like isoform X2 [Gigantopelta aegis]